MNVHKLNHKHPLFIALSLRAIRAVIIHSSCPSLGVFIHPYCPSDRITSETTRQTRHLQKRRGKILHVVQEDTEIIKVPLKDLSCVFLLKIYALFQKLMDVLSHNGCVFQEVILIMMSLEIPCFSGEVRKQSQNALRQAQRNLNHCISFNANN